MVEVTFGTQLGRGAFKTAFNVVPKPINVQNEYTFTTNIDPVKLVMVITKIELSSGEIILNNKELQNLITELRYQYNLSINDPKLAPFIYKIKVIRKTYNVFTGIQKYSSNEINIADFLTNPNTYLDSNIIRTPTSENDEIKVVVLEEKCGIPINNNNNVVINDHFIEMVTNLVFSITQLSNLFFKDFKIDNTCPVYDSSGNLINLIGLDFDPFFIESFNDIASTFEQNTNVEISNITIQNMCQGIMIVQFFVYMLKYTRRLTVAEKTLIKTNLQIIPRENLLRMVSFLSYVSPYTTTNLSITYKDICRQNLFIHYVLSGTGNYSNEQPYSYDGYKMLLKELYVELVKIIYDETITEADVELASANEFSTAVSSVEAEPEQSNIENNNNNNINLKIDFLNDKLHDYLEYLPCDSIKFLKQNSEQSINNPFIINTIPSQIRKGIVENNKKITLNENTVNELKDLLFNYIYTNKILYDDSDRGCKYYINTDIINTEEIDQLGFLITSLNNTTASGGRINKKRKVTKKRKVKKRKLTKKKISSKYITNGRNKYRHR